MSSRIASIATPDQVVDALARARASLTAQGAALHVISPLFAPGTSSLEPLLPTVIENAVQYHDCPLILHLLLNAADGNRTAITVIQQFGDMIGSVRARSDRPCMMVVATVIGGDYTHRDGEDWSSIRRVYEAIVCGVPSASTSTVATLESFYNEGLCDTTLPPTSLFGRGVRDGDGVLMLGDAGGEFEDLEAAIVDPQFCGFSRMRRPDLSFVA